MLDILRQIEHPEGLNNSQEVLFTQLFDIGAIQIGDFKLKLHDTHPEAPLSPVYINLRMLKRFPKAKLAAVNAYQELISHLEFDLLADIPNSATPLVSTLSDRLEIGMITPRIDPKTHGNGATIDGFLNSDKGKVALLIDDTITNADSKLEAVKVLTNHGLVVKDIVVLVDREQGGRQELAANSLELHSVMTMTKMLDFYSRLGRISVNDQTRINQGLQELNDFLFSVK